MQNSPWQHQLKNTINNIADLCAELDLNFDTLKHQSLNLNPKFPLKASRYYVNKIAKNDLNDPLLLQILPQAQELISSPNFCHDPLKEQEHYVKLPGLIHKYYNRVLLTVTGACAIHCRYCFRQNFPYENNIIANKQRHQQLDYIKNNININEIILSGGDPLCINNKYLDLLLSDLTSIPHIKTIRFHSRMPIIIPDRIETDLIDILNKYINQNINIILVTHCNHPNELDDYIKNKMANLKAIGVILLNQAVLLKNINDNTNTLIDLSNKLFECHILPYYLHLLDPVNGTSHYEVELGKAKSLIKEASSKLSGYLAPKLVQEIAGMPSKTLV